MTQLSATPRTLRSDIVFAFALALACYLAWLIRDALVLLYVCALFAVVLNPVVSSTARIRVGRWHPFKGSAVFFLVLVVAGAIVTFGFLALPPVIRDLHEFGGEMPARLPQLMQRFQRVPFANQLNTADVSFRLQNFASQAATYLLLSITDWAGQALRCRHGHHSDHLFHPGRRSRLPLVPLVLRA